MRADISSATGTTDAGDPGPVRAVGCTLAFSVEDSVSLACQLAPATTAGPLLSETLTVTVDGEPPAKPVVEVAAPHGGRVHVVRAAAGELHIAYDARVGVAPPGPQRQDTAPASGTAPLDPGGPPIDPATLEALRQSRYCPSDALAGWVASGLAHLPDGAGLARAIGDRVHRELDYALGVSRPVDTAVDTLLAGAGACRDFAHLTIALCRARGVPARLVAAYAPGLSPMDFHAVVEARTGGGWEVVDATRLAPRQSLVRIATGRDAADTAFATTLRGWAELTTSEVWAVVDGDLPNDDHGGPVGIG